MAVAVIENFDVCAKPSGARPIRENHYFDGRFSNSGYVAWPLVLEPGLRQSLTESSPLETNLTL